MDFRKLFLLFFLLFLWNSLSADFSIAEDKIIRATKNASYIFCFDGGGSKTALQVLNSAGDPLPLYKEGNSEGITVQRGCSNIVFLGEEAVAKVFDELLKNLSVGDKKLPARQLIPKSAFVGGFAGLGREDSYNSMHGIVEALGFNKENIALYTDAGLALELTGDAGAVLIGGTGSICFVRDQNETKRVGGLGYRFGDAGSGYWIGLEAIKASLEEEYGYGIQTELTALVKEYFEVSQCKNLITQVNGNLLPADQIASLAPLVFQKAWQGDAVALSIVSQAAHELGDLLATGIAQVPLEHCMTYLIGGLFQNSEANQFIDLLIQAPKMQQLSKEKRPLLINISDQMFPALVTQEKLRLAKNKQIDFISSLPLVQNPFSEQETETCNPEFLTKREPQTQTLKLNRLFFKNSLAGLELMHHQHLKIFDHLKPLLQKPFDEAVEKLSHCMRHNGRLFIISGPQHSHLAKSLLHNWHRAADSMGLGEFEDKVILLLDSELKGRHLLNSGAALACEEQLSDYELSAQDAYIFLTNISANFFEKSALKNLNSEGAVCLGPLKKGESLSLLTSIEELTSSNSNKKLSSDQLCENETEFIWGSVLNDTLLSLKPTKCRHYSRGGRIHLKALQAGYQIIFEKLNQINTLVKLQLDTFSDFEGRLWDNLIEPQPTYIAFSHVQGCCKNAFEINASSLSTHSSLMGFSAACCPESTRFNSILIGRNLELIDLERPGLEKKKCPKLSDFILQTNAGKNLTSSRPFMNKRLIIAFASSADPEQELFDLIQELNHLKKGKVQTALILSEIETFPISKRLFNYFDQVDFFLSLKNIPYDPLKVTHHLCRKEILHLLSQGTQMGANQIYGNMKINQLSVNKEVIEHTTKVIQKMYVDFYGLECPYDSVFLSRLVERAYKYSTLAEEQLGIYVPSVSKLVFTMLERKCRVNEALALLQFNNENIRLMLSCF